MNSCCGIGQAVILAGGMGTRLRSILPTLPKVMAEIDGQPFLQLVLQSLTNQGITDIILCIGYLGHIVEDYFKDGHEFGASIRYSREQTLLGTGGALRNALHLLNNEFLVLNGDTFRVFSAASMYKQFQQCETGNAEILMGIYNVDDCSSYGNVLMTANGQITGFAEKENNFGGFANAGIYIMKYDCVRKIQEDVVCSLEQDVLPRAAKEGVLFSYTMENAFFDIGTPERLRHFEMLSDRYKNGE